MASRIARRRWPAAALLITLAFGSIWSACTSAAPPSRPNPGAATSESSPTPAPVPELDLTLARLSGRSSTGRAVAPWALRPAAAAVRGTMTELYSAGFVDPASWDGGAFPSLFRVLAPEARPQAHRDLDELSLGPVAGELDAVVPRRARLDLRFLTDANRHPTAAFARVEFHGVGIAGGVHVPLRQEGRYTLRRGAEGWKVEGYQVRSRIPSPSQVRAKVRTASLSPPPPHGLLFVLAIGSDARPGQPLATRGDSLHLIGVNPSRGLASVVGIPRDSWVMIPGRGYDKINAALAYGGPELMVRTVERLSGIPIDAYALTGFQGFVQMVNAVDGIDVTIPYPIHDHYSHANFRAGPAHLNGRSALAFARNRHDAPGGDFGRSLNQGRLLIGAFRQLRAELARDPTNVIPWVVAGSRYLRTDLDLGRMLELLLATGSIDPSHVGNEVVTGSGALIGGKSVVLLGAKARAIFRDLADDAVLGR